jgi:hypothetical protein
MAARTRLLSITAGLLWYGSLLAIAIAYADGVVRSWTGAPLVARAIRIVGGVLIVTFFAFVHAAVAARPWPHAVAAQGKAPAAPGKVAFPTQPTVYVGVWLLLYGIVSVVLVLLCIYPPQWTRILEKVFEVLPDQVTEGNQALITMFAAGVGAWITTAMGYLEHASDKKDFEAAYAPWYVARPMIGMLLGLVFYFLIRGGLLLTIDPAHAIKAEDLNSWGLAAIGALIGLFSKNAIGKLREVFNTLFRTEKEAQQERTGTWGEAKEKLLDLLPEEEKRILLFGNWADLRKGLAGLSQEMKDKLRTNLPSDVRGLLEPFLEPGPAEQAKPSP